VHSRGIQFIAWENTSLLFMAELHFTIWVYHISFIDHQNCVCGCMLGMKFYKWNLSQMMVHV
jgi:hypothetical protein